MQQINELCTEHKVKQLFAFGSVTRDALGPDSDIDLMVEIDEADPYSYTDNYFNLKFGLEDLLHRQIDLLEHGALRNPILKAEIDRTKVLIYGR